MRFHAGAVSSCVEDEHDAVRALLVALGERPDRAGVIDTPRRVVEAWRELTSGSLSDLDSVVGKGVFEMDQLEGEHPGVVAMCDIPFSCVSAETLLPIYGKCHAAYRIEGNRILGLSKIARLARAVSRKIQTQQEFTEALVDAIAKKTGSSKVLVLATATQVRYDCPLRVVCTSASSPGLEDGSEEFQELEAILPLTAAGTRREAESPLTKMICDPETLERVQSSIRSLMAALHITLPRQDALIEYGRQLCLATAGLREMDALNAEELQIQCDSDDENNAQRTPQSASCVLGFTSTCEHHLLPFHGRVFVGCSASDPSASISGLVTAVSDFLASRSRRPQVQERLTNEIADFVSEEFRSASVVVLCEAHHLCMIARGPQTHDTETRTACRRGVVPAELLRRGRAALDRTSG